MHLSEVKVQIVTVICAVVHKKQKSTTPAVPKHFWARPKSEFDEHPAAQASNSTWRK